MATVRKMGAAVTVWSHATNATTVNRSAQLMSATITVDNDTEDSSGAPADWGSSVGLRGNYTISAEEIIDNTSAYDILKLAAAAAPTAIITFTTGGGSYTGTAAIRSCKLACSKGLQKISVDMVGIGALGVA